MREMKDSGVEWIGEIPKEWTVSKISFFSKSRSGATPDRNKIEYWAEGTIPWMASGEVNKIYVYDTKERITEIAVVETSAKLLPENSVMIALNGQGKTKGMSAIIKIKCACNQSLCAFQCDEIRLHYRYLFYCFQSMYKYLRNQKGDDQRDGLAASFIRKQSIPISNIQYQKKCADYLDSKCSKIDVIIEKQEAIIEKLKEYKLSLITEAVTKGLSSGVEIKNSNIDICDEIPCNWKVSQIRHLFQLRDEKNYKPLEEVQLLSLYTELGVFPHGEQEERGNKAVKAEGYKVVYEGDIIVNIILAWMGAIGRSAYNGVTSPAYDIYKPLKGVYSEYFHYMFRTKVFSGECYKYGRGIMAMRWRTYSSEFKSIKVPVPPYEEQKAIAKYLDEKCKLIDKTIKERENAIDKLLKYKKSLVYEVVTGKREVL